MRATPVERGLDKDDAPWKAAWPLPHLVDPLKRYAHGGLEVETEVVMGWLLTQDDLEAKVRKSTEHQVSGDEQDSRQVDFGRFQTVPRQLTSFPMCTQTGIRQP